MTRKIIIAILLIIIAFLAYDFFIKPPSFNNGTKAPDFSDTLINGESFKLSDLKGDYVLLDFWGSWCGPCLKEMPTLIKLYDRYHNMEFKDGGNFHIVSIALEKSDKLIRSIISSRGLDWDYHIIDVNQIVMFSSIGQLYGVKVLPTKFLINPDGNIMGTNLSVSEISVLLEERVRK